MKLRSAIKYCRASRLSSLADCLVDELVPTRNDRKFTISFTMDFRVYYHSPSLMMNVTQIQLVAGILDAIRFDSVPNSRAQSVYGPPKWRGLYIDQPSLQKLPGEMRNHGIDFSYSTFQRTSSQILEQRFLDVDSVKYSVLVSEQLHPHMVLVRNSDGAIHLGQLLGEPDAWLGSISDHAFCKLDEVKQYCTFRNLRRSAAMLDNLYYVDGASWEDAMLGDVDDEATSLNTTKSLQEEEAFQRQEREMQFTFKKRARTGKGTAGSRERLEAWLDNLYGSDVEREPLSRREERENPDIIPTVFTRTSNRSPTKISRQGKRSKASS